MPYAMSVIVSRAIPEIDGFKPSQRKLLYTMYKMKLLTGNKTKSANVVGQTMKLNPHGDQAIYATMVRLTTGYDALLLPYVDSKGNFGKSTSRDMKFAASRYTEVKLDNICHEVFKDIDKDTVDFVDNYDATLLEPTLLPTTFPNILANPNKGVAVGMASNICSFNLKELCETTINFLDDRSIDLTETLLAPDFSTGCYLLYSKDQIKKIYETGLGSFKLRAKYEYAKKDNCIEIKEIPYTTTVEQIIEKIADMAKNNKLKEISDVRDETDLGGLKVTLDLKRGVDPDKLMAKLFRYTTLEDSFSCNFNILVNGRPRLMGIKEILHEWTAYRIICIKRQLTYDISNLQKNLHLLYGLQKVLLDLDATIKIIRETKENRLVVPNLMEAFSIDETQANYVADIKLRNINKEYILNRISEVGELEKELDKLNQTLNSERRIKTIIKRQLKEVSKKFGKDRVTEIMDLEAAVLHQHEDHIEDYNLKYFFTDHNYFKKVSLVSLRSSGDHKLKDDDELRQELDGNNLDEVLFFSDKCSVYKMKSHEISDHKVSQLGHYLPNLLELPDDEKILFVHNTRDYHGYMIFAFENGKVAKVPLNAYQTKTNRKKLLNAYSDYSKVISIHFITEDIPFAAIRYASPNEYRLSVLDSSLITEKSTRNTRGVQVIRMKKNSSMSHFVPADTLTIHDMDEYTVDAIPKSGKEYDMSPSKQINLVDS